MAYSYCLCHTQTSSKIDRLFFATRPGYDIRMDQRTAFALKGVDTELFGKRVPGSGAKLSSDRSFMGGSRIVIASNPGRFFLRRKSSGIHASCDALNIATASYTC